MLLAPAGLTGPCAETQPTRLGRKSRHIRVTPPHAIHRIHPGFSAKETERASRVHFHFKKFFTCSTLSTFPAETTLPSTTRAGVLITL